MQGVLEGFTTIGTIIALGILLAHTGVLDTAAQVMLSRLSFMVASPALMITVLGHADLASVFSRNLAATASGVAVAALLYILAARLVWRSSTTDTVIGTLSSTYVNAGNLGLPIAAYVLGDAALVAPTLLMQLLVMQPIALTVMDHAVHVSRFSVGRTLLRPVKYPLTVGSLIGLGLALTDAKLPHLVSDPLGLVAGMAVPAMLLAYGVSLRLGPTPGRGTPAAELGLVTVLKLGVQPVATYLVARFVLDLADTSLLAVTVLAALPTAQNVFVYATRYARAELIARDAIFVTTMLSIPVLFVIAALLA